MEFNIFYLHNDIPFFQLINGTGLLSFLESEANVTSRKMPGKCIGLLFYASYCPFSCLAAPYFNALPRTFPAIKFAAIDSMKHYRYDMLC